MKTKIKKIEGIAITAIAFLAIFALIGTASATVSNLAISAGTHFYGENITVTWESNSPLASYIWINANTSWHVDIYKTWDNKSWRMYNDYPGATGFINQTQVQSTGGSEPYTFTYTFANNTVNESAGATPEHNCQYWIAYVNDAGVSTFPTDITGKNKTFMMNAYNVTIAESVSDTVGRSAADLNSTLAGDNITVWVNTSGLQAGSTRDGLPFSITLPEGGNEMFSGCGNTAGSGNYSFTINTTKAGVGMFKNITMSLGTDFSWNSTQLVTNAGLWGADEKRLQFNVSKLNLKAYDMPVDINAEGTAVYNITAVNITTVDSSGNLMPANPAYGVNITIINSQTSMCFNSSHDGRWASPYFYKANVTFIAGDGSAARVGATAKMGGGGNYTEPLNTSGDATGIQTGYAGTHTITAIVNTSGMAWTDDYVIHPTTVYNKINTPATGTSYQIGELINITGWNSTGAAGQVWLNITEPSTTKINISNINLNPTDGSFTFTWDTNWTWNDQQDTTWNSSATKNKTGAYKLWFGNSTAYDDVITIYLRENITVSPNATTMPVNGSLWINGTTDRWNSNCTVMWCNISTQSDRTGTIINDTLKDTILNFDSTTGLGSYGMVWNSSDNITQIEATSGVPWNTFSKTYYITVNDSATKNTTATITITDSITVNAATGVPGYNFTARGTTPRQNGTVINVSLHTLAGIPIRYVDTTAHNGAWNASINASSGSGATEIPLPGIESYNIIANDSIVKAKNTLTLGTGVIDFEVIPAETTMDGIVWFNGTTDLANGTLINFNITTSTGKSVNKTDSRTDMSAVNATVDANSNFNKSWQVNASWIGGNFTAPLTTLTVNASNGTIINTATFTVNETLTITTSDVEIATGGEFKVEGTLNRDNDYTVQIVTATSGGITTNETTATVFNGAWNTTLTATYSMGNLPADTYTITAKDSPSATSSIINASASINMTVVATGSITLISPTDGATYDINTTVPLSGTTNIGNDTVVTVTIMKSGFHNASITARSDHAGAWSAAWNMTADSAFQALTTKSGDYQIIAANGSTVSAAHTITVTAPAELTVTRSPISVVVGTPTAVLFTVTSNGAPIGTATVTLSGCGVSTSDTTDASGLVAISVNATSEGTIDVTASKTGYTDGTTTITATTEVDWNTWDDDGVITTTELQEAVNCWLTDTPKNDHIVTTSDLQGIVNMWLTT